MTPRNTAFMCPHCLKMITPAQVQKLAQAKDLEATLLDVMRLRRWIAYGARMDLIPPPHPDPDDPDAAPTLAVFRLLDLTAALSTSFNPEAKLTHHYVSRLFALLGQPPSQRKRWGQVIYIDPTIHYDDDQIQAALGAFDHNMIVARNALDSIINGESTDTFRPALNTYPYRLKSPASKKYETRDHVAIGIAPLPKAVSAGYGFTLAPIPAQSTEPNPIKE